MRKESPRISRAGCPASRRRVRATLCKRVDDLRSRRAEFSAAPPQRNRAVERNDACRLAKLCQENPSIWAERTGRFDELILALQKAHASEVFD